MEGEGLLPDRQTGLTSGKSAVIIHGHGRAVVARDEACFIVDVSGVKSEEGK